MPAATVAIGRLSQDPTSLPYGAARLKSWRHGGFLRLRVFGDSWAVWVLRVLRLWEGLCRAFNPSRDCGLWCCQEDYLCYLMLLPPLRLLCCCCHFFSSSSSSSCASSSCSSSGSSSCWPADPFRLYPPNVSSKGCRSQTPSADTLNSNPQPDLPHPRNQRQVEV